MKKKHILWLPLFGTPQTGSQQGPSGFRFSELPKTISFAVWYEAFWVLLGSCKKDRQVPMYTGSKPFQWKSLAPPLGPMMRRVFPSIVTQTSCFSFVAMPSGSASPRYPKLDQSAYKGKHLVLSSGLRNEKKSWAPAEKEAERKRIGCVLQLLSFSTGLMTWV